MFTLSGADLIRDLYAYCSDLGERMGDAAQVKPGYAIKLALRLFLLDDVSTVTASASSFYLSSSPVGEFFWLRRLLQVTLCSL